MNQFTNNTTDHFASSADIIINLQALQYNYKIICNITSKNNKKTTVAAAVKYDAYGLGIDKIAPALYEVGCRDFFVSCLKEGIYLRKLFNKLTSNDQNKNKKEDINIYILHGIFESEEDYFIKYNLIAVINDIFQFNLLKNYIRNHKSKLTKISILLHIYTAMHRLSLSLDEFNIIANDEDLNKFDIKYIISHLACADNANHPMNRKQLNNFTAAKNILPKVKRSLAASDGVFLGEDYFFDMVRVGGALYGIKFSDNIKDINIKNILTIRAPIIKISNIKKGETIGYTNNYTAKSDMRIATIAIGYADNTMSNGRFFSNLGYFYLDNIKLPIVGNISMDLTVVDISHIDQNKCKIGDYVIICDDHHLLNDISSSRTTIDYEVITAIGKRFNRIYI